MLTSQGRGEVRIEINEAINQLVVPQFDAVYAWIDGLQKSMDGPP